MKTFKPTALVLCLASAVSAQPSAPGQKGDWVTYRLKMGEARSHFLRLAVVAEVKDPLGNDASWWEVEWGQERTMTSPIAQMKILIAKSQGFTREGIRRVIVIAGSEQPQEVQLKMLEPFTLPSAPAVPTLGVPVMNTVALNWRLGKVRASAHLLRDGINVVEKWWISPEVPLLHLARLEIPSVGLSMDLDGFGHDAIARLVIPSPQTAMVALEGSSNEMVSNQR